MPVTLCRTCAGPSPPSSEEIQLAEESFKCALCFGLFDNDLCTEVAEKCAEEFRKQGYDGDNFIMALNFPVSMILREAVAGKLYEDLQSPKEQLQNYLMSRIGQVSGLRPSLSSDLTLTVSFANDEFDEKDVEYLLTHFPNEFMSTGRKRKPALDDVRSLFTKVKVTTIGRSMTRETASKYPLTSPSRRCAFTVAFEREQLFVGARYRKFSRDLPQSPWTINAETPKLPGNSVSEKVCKTLETHFAADATRFIASGREDIDVRMLGSGRPFAVQLLNARKVASLRPKTVAETLARLTEEINKDVDINISPLAKVSTKQALQLNVGQEEKKKTYSALCGSSEKITPEMLKKLEACIPLEIVQKTPIRVLKRRPLLDRKRNIFALKTLQLDDKHFFVRLETQAGTYVKEFVHGDFGRTRPSISELLGLEPHDVDILQLDVEGVDLDWPPKE